MDFERIREQMAEYLIGQGIDAVCAYPDRRRLHKVGAVAAVCGVCALVFSLVGLRGRR